MNEDVEKAVEVLDATSKRFTGPHFMVMKLAESKDAWQTIRQALRDQEAEIARMEKVTRLVAEAVRREAFKMPPPNEWTPIFVMLANEADYRITDHPGAEQ